MSGLTDTHCHDLCDVGLCEGRLQCQGSLTHCHV